MVYQPAHSSVRTPMGLVIDRRRWSPRSAGRISPVEGVAACAVGIYMGDALLWLAGRLRVDPARRAGQGLSLSVWGKAPVSSLDAPTAILASRFIPGSRLPLYLAAGVVGAKPGSFLLWTFVAVLLWTPLVVLGTPASVAAGIGLIAAIIL